MELRKVRNYKTPGYPQKTEVSNNPELLRNLPSRWKGNLYACVAASSLFMVALSGCGKLGDDSVNTGDSGLNNASQAPVNTGVTPTIKKSAPGVIPPVFVHGDGSGSFGCTSVAPPVFLSEEEAYQVICDESRAYGMDFKRDGLEIKDTEIPSTFIYFIPEMKNTVNGLDGDLTVDGYDENKKIGFEFVSKDDFVGWKAGQQFYSSVESYNVLKAAEVLQKGLTKKNDGNTIGVFYDPMPQVNVENFKNTRIKDISINDKVIDGIKGEAERRQEAIMGLRAQVKDFLNWLKAEGII